MVPCRSHPTFLIVHLTNTSLLVPTRGVNDVGGQKGTLFVFWAPTAVSQIKGLKQEEVIFPGREARSPRPRCSQDRFLLRTLFLACQWSSLGACLCPNLLFLYRDMSHIGFGSTLINSFYLNYLLKDPISKYSHFLRYWEFTFLHMNSGQGGDTIQSITGNYSSFWRRHSTYGS